MVSPLDENSPADTSQVAFSALDALGRVCSLWRDILLGNSVFWNRIDLTKPRFATLCLERCRADLPIHLRGALSIGDVSDAFIALNRLSRVAPHLKSIRLNGNLCMWNVLPSLKYMIPDATFSKLTELHLRGDPRLPFFGSCSFRLPVLHTLRVCDVILKFQYPFSSLKHADLRCTMLDEQAMSNFITSLDRMPTLEVLRMSFDGFRTGQLRIQSLGSNTFSCILPCLETLFLSGSPGPFVTHFYNAVQMPALKTGTMVMPTNSIGATLSSSGNPFVDRLRECHCDLSLIIRGDTTAPVVYLALVNLNVGASLPDSSHFVPLNRPSHCTCLPITLTNHRPGVGGATPLTFHFQGWRRLTSRVVNLSIQLDILDPSSFSPGAWSHLFGDLPVLEHITVRRANMLVHASGPSFLDMVSALVRGSRKQEDGTFRYCPRLRSLLVSYANLSSMEEHVLHDDQLLFQMYDLRPSRPLMLPPRRLPVIFRIPKRALNKLVTLDAWKEVCDMLDLDRLLRYSNW